jgi:hypothetical protein
LYPRRRLAFEIVPPDYFALPRRQPKEREPHDLDNGRVSFGDTDPSSNVAKEPSNGRQFVGNVRPASH